MRITVESNEVKVFSPARREELVDFAAGNVVVIRRAFPNRSADLGVGVGGSNVTDHAIDDRHQLRHGACEAPTGPDFIARFVRLDRTVPVIAVITSH